MENRNFTDIDRLLFEQRERLKELNAINKASRVVKDNKPLEETLQDICNLLPPAMQFPAYAIASVEYGGLRFVSSPMFDQNNPLFIEAKFQSFEGTKGRIVVQYRQEILSQVQPENLFLKEEVDLLNNMAVIIAGYLNSQRALQATQFISTSFAAKENLKNEDFKLFHAFLQKRNEEKNVYRELMNFSVKEILLISTLYDAFYIINDREFGDVFFNQLFLNEGVLFPRITGASSEDDVFEKLMKKHFDLIIYMVNTDMSTPLKVISRIKAEYPYIPVYLLINSKESQEEILSTPTLSGLIDKIFLWNGDSRLIFSMVKLLEDQRNFVHDTLRAYVRFMLFVEDDPWYYSRMLPQLYAILYEQIHRILSETVKDPTLRMLKFRARPKIIHVESYEKAIDFLDKYGEYALSVFSDVKFYRGGKLDKTAGEKLLQYLVEHHPGLPVVLHSSEYDNSRIAHQYKAVFIHKESDFLLDELKSFMLFTLHFGSLIFRTISGEFIAEVKNLADFEKVLHNIPPESLEYHLKRNNFIHWLLAQGEIELVRKIRERKIFSHQSLETIRNELIEIIHLHREEENKGKILLFDEVEIFSDSHIVLLGNGNIGGKGRGLTFLQAILSTSGLFKTIGNVQLKMPRTAIIGTDEFEYFMQHNDLLKIALNEEYEAIKQAFAKAKLSPRLEKQLRKLLKMLHKPLAIRSSSLFEDSVRQPFAGIFETYFIPNQHENFEERYRQLTMAIKMVYASVYSPVAKAYFQSVGFKIEDEKMAVVIQEVVGSNYENSYWYPHISGTAQSYNYYPLENMAPEDGVAVLALGLGKYVVEGEKAYRFCPKYPTVSVHSPKEELKSTQTEFLAIDLRKKDFNLIEGEEATLVRLDLFEAEKHGTLKHLASTYDVQSDTLKAGIHFQGPRVLNFANILKHNYVSLALTITTLLETMQEAMGGPVEIEYAVQLKSQSEPSADFYMLQIKPMMGHTSGMSVEFEEVPHEKCLIKAERSMGHGIITNISHVLYVMLDKFDKTKTELIAKEISLLNQRMKEINKQYILIGPGRWGSRDKFIGIPVQWNDITQAKIILELGLDDFPLDASMGSHFFHNVTSLNIGYLSIDPVYNRGNIHWELLNKQKIVEQLEYVRLIEFEQPLKIVLDGKKRRALVHLV